MSSKHFKSIALHLMVSRTSFLSLF